MIHRSGGEQWSACPPCFTFWRKHFTFSQPLIHNRSSSVRLSAMLYLLAEAPVCRLLGAGKVQYQSRFAARNRSQEKNLWLTCICNLTIELTGRRRRKAVISAAERGVTAHWCQLAGDRPRSSGGPLLPGVCRHGRAQTQACSRICFHMCLGTLCMFRAKCQQSHRFRSPY